GHEEVAAVFLSECAAAVAHHARGGRVAEVNHRRQALAGMVARAVAKHRGEDAALDAMDDAIAKRMLVARQERTAGEPFPLRREGDLDRIAHRGANHLQLTAVGPAAVDARAFAA